MKTCRCCGKQLGEFTLDIAYQLPDVVWAIPEEERADRAKFNTDLCQYADRFYLRGILYTPIIGEDQKFGWGLWAEVDEEVFQKYLSVYDTDGTGQPPVAGVLANTPPGYEGAEGVRIQIHFGPSTERPEFVAEPSSHLFYREQTEGITVERVHELNKRHS